MFFPSSNHFKSIKLNHFAGEIDVMDSPSLNKYSVGHHAELSEPLRKHSSIQKGFTGKANDWELVYTELCPEKQEA